VLVGGSTRTPLIGRLLEERLGQPAHREINPDLCVALGAAIQGAIIAGENVGAVLVDITPHSLGIKCLEYTDDFRMRANEHKFAAILKRNSPLPASSSEVFCTVIDHQPMVEIDVFQGESPDVRQNHRIGKFLIEGLAKVPAGNQLVVQLDLTLDGILKVSAREKSTGLVKQITIDNALARYAIAERAGAQKRLDRMWSDLDALMPEAAEPSTEGAIGMSLGDMIPAPPTEGQREAVQARALLEKAERIRAKVNAEDQDELNRLMNGVKSALEERKWATLETACNELSDVLFYLEDA
jgi:molecular chaperone DnaK